MNTRKKLTWLLLVFAAIAWFGLKNPVYRAVTASSELPTNAPASFEGEDGWALLPVEPTPGAWNDPWGVDLYILPPPSGAKAGRGLVDIFHEPTRRELAQSAQVIESAFSAAGPSYSAIYRHPSPSVNAKAEDWDVARLDAEMAFERYLHDKNKWRGVLLIASPDTGHLVAPILARIEKDPRLLERFSGLVVLYTGTSAPQANVTCSPAMQGDCVVAIKVARQTGTFNWLVPQLYRQPLVFEIEDVEPLSRELTARNLKLSIWLDKNAPKPAEPLGGLDDIEVIEIAPIRSPGETGSDDENLSRDD